MIHSAKVQIDSTCHRNIGATRVHQRSHRFTAWTLRHTRALSEFGVLIVFHYIAKEAILQITGQTHADFFYLSGPELSTSFSFCPQDHFLCYGVITVVELELVIVAIMLCPNSHFLMRQPLVLLNLHSSRDAFAVAAVKEARSSTLQQVTLPLFDLTIHVCTVLSIVG